MLEILDAVVWAMTTGPLKFNAPALTSRECGVQMEGHPPPVAGSFYISVDDGGTSATGGDNEYLSETHMVNVWVSLRCAELPPDRSAKILGRVNDSLQKLERQVLRAIHGQDSVRQQANTYLSGRSAGEGVFQLPLYYQGRTGTVIQPSDWSLEFESDRMSGWYVRRLPFAGMQRTQLIDSIT